MTNLLEKTGNIVSLVTGRIVCQGIKIQLLIFTFLLLLGLILSAKLLKMTPICLTAVEVVGLPGTRASPKTRFGPNIGAPFVKN